MVPSTGTVSAEVGEAHAVIMVSHTTPRTKGDACCLLYTSDAADERSSVDLGGRRIIKKKKQITVAPSRRITDNTTPRI